MIRKDLPSGKRLLAVVATTLLVTLLLGVTGCKDSAEPKAQAGELASAKESYEAGRFSEAEETLVAVLESDPENVDALSILALAQAAQGKNQEAIDQYTIIVRLNPDDHGSWYRMALLERVIGQPKKTVEHLEKALAEDPGNPSYTDELARTKMSLGDYRGAADLWGSLIDADEDLSKESEKELLMLQGQAYQEAKEYDSALASFKKALALDPEDEALQDRVDAFQ